ncbi:MAG: hypothetical protein DI539_03125 [Flavobacterium psychrophilum]|nr:MAG: hypothetical protein DI539_03125 [Flavobacterium psychrophilum]
MKLSKAERRKQQKILLRKQVRKDKAIYAAFIACMILCVVVGVYKPLSIGTNIIYIFFVLILPILTGIGLIIYYRKKLIDTNAVAAVTNVWKKAGYGIILLLIVSLFSFITIGTFASLTFEVANYYTAKESKQRTVTLPVDEFHKGKGSKASYSIRFRFEDKKESIRVSRNFIEKCIEQSATKHRISLKLRKGLWNHYLVDDWNIVK